VEHAYEKILGRVDKEDELTVKQILQIVVGARRPLTINEMAIALGIATSTDADWLATVKVDHEGLGDRIRDLCGLFIFINHSKVYPIHPNRQRILDLRKWIQHSCLWMETLSRSAKCRERDDSNMCRISLLQGCSIHLTVSR
jgi:hypothetical protein